MRNGSKREEDKRRLLVVVCLISYSRCVLSMEFLMDCLKSEKECAHKSTGQYPACAEVDQYVRCMLGTGAMLSCSTGQRYDSLLGTCINRPVPRSNARYYNPSRQKMKQERFEEVSQVTLTFPPGITLNTPPRTTTPPPLTTGPVTTASDTSTSTSIVTTTTTTATPDAGLPIMEGADSVCSTTTFVCQDGYVWVGPQPQSVDFDFVTGTWASARGHCQLQDTVPTTPPPGTEFTVPPPEAGSLFGVCLQAQPSSDKSRITVSFMSKDNAVLRFTIDYSTNDTVLGSAVGSTELYHIFLNDDCSRFLDLNHPFQLRVQQVSLTVSEYELTDGQLAFTGTVEEVADSKLNLDKVDRVEVNGDVRVLMVNTKCPR